MFFFFFEDDLIVVSKFKMAYIDKRNNYTLPHDNVIQKQ